MLRFYANGSTSYTLLAFTLVVVGLLAGLGVYVFLTGALLNIFTQFVDILAVPLLGGVGQILLAPAETFAESLTRVRATIRHSHEAM